MHTEMESAGFGARVAALKRHQQQQQWVQGTEQQSAQEQQQQQGSAPMEAEPAAPAAAAAGFADRLAALRRRQQRMAGDEQPLPQQQQQQQQWQAEDWQRQQQQDHTMKAGFTAATDLAARLALLRQRQAGSDEQQQQQLEQQPAAGQQQLEQQPAAGQQQQQRRQHDAPMSVDKVATAAADVAARLARLRQQDAATDAQPRQEALHPQIDRSLQQQQQHRGPTVSSQLNGVALADQGHFQSNGVINQNTLAEPDPVGFEIASAAAAPGSLLQRVQILLQRQATQQQQHQQRGKPKHSEESFDSFSEPEQFVQQLQSMLASGQNFPMPLWETDCELDCEVYRATGCAGTSEQAAATIAAAAVDDDGVVAETCEKQQRDSEHPPHMQQQQQPAEHAIPGHIRRLLTLAAQSLSRQRYSEARDRAAAAAAQAVAAASNAAGSSSSAVASFCREAEKLQAVAILLNQVPQQHWLAALQLDQHNAGAAAGIGSTNSTSTQDIQRAYRRLAALVHPDKCKHPSAEAAFKSLVMAYEQALAAVGGQGLHNQDVDEFDKTCGDSGAGGGDEYAWWSEWERDLSAGRVNGAAAAAGGGSSAPTAADDEQELWQLSIQELVAEVKRRQAGVLSPQEPTDVARAPHERQKRLRVARTVLSARMQQTRQAAVAAEAGDDEDVDFGAGGGFVPDHYWGDWKRQRR